jgi:hypothetical protein
MKIFFAVISALLVLGHGVSAFGNGDKSMRAQITVAGLKHESSEEYISVFNNAFLEAFNLVHPKRGFNMDSSKVEKEIDVPANSDPIVTIFEDEGTALGGQSGSYSWYYAYFWTRTSYS